jgi:hypothetical protein
MVPSGVGGRDGSSSFVRFVVNEAQRLQRMEPAPDYDDLPPDYDDDDATVTTYNKRFILLNDVEILQLVFH